MKEIYKFKSYPLLRYPVKGIFAICVIITVIIISYKFTNYYILPVLAFFVTMVPISNFMFPTSYEFHDEHFTITQLFYKVTRNYDDFAGFAEASDGVLLIQTKHKSDFIYIFDKEVKSKVINLLSENDLEEARNTIGT